MSRWIKDWNPEDERFWRTRGRRVATRNLSFSIFAEFLGFTVWQLWAIVAVKLPDAGFDFSTTQLFWLVAVPGLVGATMRFPYTFAPARFGGRNWTIVSASLLLIPTALLVVMVTNPGTPYWLFIVAAATAGLVGGNFASSMANISYFYPERAKGLALGLNAAGGNIGVAVVLLLAPLVIGVGLVGGAQGGSLHLQNAALIWMPLILIAAFCAWRFMDNLSSARSTFGDQRVVLHQRHTWLMTVLYIGAFGSFIGYSAGLPLLMKNQFPEEAISLAFLGPLVGSLARPGGGWLSDRFGGARVTLAAFSAMSLATLGVVWCLAHRAEPWAFGAFLGAFMVLFVLSGIANGSTFRMVPAIWRARAIEESAGGGTVERERAMVRAKREGAAVLGVISAVAAYGGFVIPQCYSLSLSLTGGPQLALVVFSAYYVLSAALTWTVYVRTAPRRSGLIEAEPAEARI